MPCWAIDAGPKTATDEQARHLRHLRRQRWRRATQAGFFLLFLVAPALDWLRFDLHEAQLWVLGQRWHLGLDDPATAPVGIMLRGIVPALLLAGGFLAVAYRWGRLYCGWLCPHFSLVEALNGLLHRASGRLSLWDREAVPGGGSGPGYWILFVLVALLFGFVWSITLLTYLLPPSEIWHGLVHASLTPNQARFLFIAWAVISAELVFARHLFCRFGCAVGFFQSLAWMANPKALVVSFQRGRAMECKTCQPVGDACEHACPMRLRPRTVKRLMFSCSQCGRCLSACETSHTGRGRDPNLQWTVGVDALRETLPSRR